MTVDFIRHTWQDWPSTETPITADELNRLEEGIAGLYSDLDGIDLANIEQTVDDLEEAVENFKAGVEITQAAYDNLTPEEKNNGTVYYITDAPSTPAISALDASYNNSTSGLQATNVQSAVDELNSNPGFVVESGTSGIWTYRKYSDGMAECWGVKTTSTGFTSWGSSYESTSVIDPGSYPTNLFCEKPIVIASPTQQDGDYWLHISTNPVATKENPSKYYGMRATARDSMTIGAYLYVRGKWK